MHHRRHTVLLTGALCFILFALPSAGSDAHGDEQHTPPPAETVPRADFVLGDAMRLIAEDFATVRNAGSTIGMNAEAKAQALRATQNAQRYLRIAAARWAPDRGFHQAAAEAEAAWALAEAAARAGNADEVQALVERIGGSCKSCHETYRKDS